MPFSSCSDVRNLTVGQTVLCLHIELWAKSVVSCFPMEKFGSNREVLGWGGQTMEQMILEDAQNFTKFIERKCKNGNINNMKTFTSLAVLNSLWSIIKGSRYDLESGDPKVMKTLETMNRAVKNSNVTGGILNHLPFLRHVAPKFSGYDELNERLNKTWIFFADEVTRHKDSWQPGIRRDFIDVYLEEIEARKNDPTSTFNEMQLVALLKDFFAAGIDTTSNSIEFTIGYMTVCPDIQDKVQAELDKVIGKDNLPSLAFRNSLPYLNAVLKEVLRISNIGPTTIPHRATVDSTFMGYEIKKNYTVLPNLMSVHMDKEHWGDPEAFRPERFIDEHGEFVNDPWLIPFGSGRRKCLGETLAKNTHFLFVVCLLQKFRFKLPNGQAPPSMLGKDGFTMSAPEFDIVVTPR
ncbi:methyl farnesoate epoxidase-like isoform X2 [Venturia canescens]|uniref:methyl farnesoate epoxidase-like isoform X2 n=1 Tax=Venturia canescens TaxID=32260 RepID=UPI001C9D0019|nr:methyl farnesoate epoxidase-like isoform X2 [Venturia canescens]XP_043266955.1 methyl farnesoate epoxidase-like isoform X2 [Venturia canescens]